ncbi:hypothetical protein NDU88_002595 [Pleurodeles waltl]|uniref:MADS-box domain-containing protein n=1 Tax=Pleurodeles waltl TaxID=8319 RepID=A0AAV7VCY9_PLEWA|nr:hypothetical protein NDU88_002595 [Pleurodeles waltl]
MMKNKSTERTESYLFSKFKYGTEGMIAKEEKTIKVILKFRLRHQRLVTQEKIVRLHNCHDLEESDMRTVEKALSDVRPQLQDLKKKKNGSLQSKSLNLRQAPHLMCFAGVIELRGLPVGVPSGRRVVLWLPGAASSVRPPALERDDSGAALTRLCDSPMASRDSEAQLDAFGGR